MKAAKQKLGQLERAKRPTCDVEAAADSDGLWDALTDHIHPRPEER